ncbi:MAG: hypothetical protein ACWIPH_07800 [Ostreibacterium sp.]
MATLMQQDVLQELASGIGCHLIRIIDEYEDKIPNFEGISEKHRGIIRAERTRIFRSETEDLNFKKEAEHLRQLEKAFFVEVGLIDYWQEGENARLERVKNAHKHLLSI